MKNIKTIFFFIFIIAVSMLHETNCKMESQLFNKKALTKKSRNASKSDNNNKIKSMLKTKQTSTENRYKPNTDLWVKCANQDQNCELTPGMKYMVKYGKPDSWKFREVDGQTIKCSNPSFKMVGWECIFAIAGRMNGKNAECYSNNGRNCIQFTSNEECRSFVIQNENNTDIVPVTCGENHKKIYGITGYENPYSWCSVHRDILTRSCYIKNNAYKWNKCSSSTGLCISNSPSIVKVVSITGNVSFESITNTFKCHDPLNLFVNSRERTCYVLEDKLWKHCSNQHETCQFNGTQLVRYGPPEGNFIYKQVNGSILCNNSNMGGDPAVGNTSKICEVHVGSIVWIPCASENMPCEIPGEALVRFGAEQKYVIKKHKGTIPCHHFLFGSNPINKPKKCEYAIYNTQDIPSSIMKLTDHNKNAPVAKSDALNFSTCSDSQGFGFSGNCLTRPSQLANDAPAETKLQTPFVFGVLGLNPLIPFNFCIGDFTGTDLSNSYEMSQNKCDTIPLMKEFTYGSMSGVMKDVPCGKPVEVSFCVSFDRCGTVALVVNGGLLTCAATYSTGIGAIMSLFSDALDFIGFGVSVKRRFTYEFSLAYRNGTQVSTRKVNSFGHFFLKIGFSIPLGDLQIGTKKLKDFFSFNIEALLMIDFGNSLSTINSIVNEVMNANKDTGKAIVDKIVQTNAEITFGIKGIIVLNINSLTNGFLPDINLEVASASILLSFGKNGASGMNRGIYFYLSSGINNPNELFQAIVAPITPLLSVFGVKLPTINANTSIGLGMFVTDDSLGLTLTVSGINVYCLCIYADKGCSCGVNGTFFTAILEWGNWVVRQARQIGEKIGKVAVKFANETGKFAENAANATAEFFQNDAKNFFERDIGNALGSTVQEVGDFFKNEVGGALNDAGDVISDVGNDIVDGAEDLGNDIADAMTSW